jgi:transcriptional regulator of arginine metabolism
LTDDAPLDDPASRRALIATILREQGAASQGALAQALKKRGVRASQPVLSRDLRALGAVKRDGAYSLTAEEVRVTPLAALRPLLRSVRAAGPHMVIIACEPGAASSLARALEAEALDGVAGTLAGDDTIFVAVSSPAAAKRVQQHVAALL